MSLLKKVRREFRLAGLYSGNDPEAEKLVSDLEALISTFEAQNHSTTTKYMTLNLFDRLINGFPLTPLSGGPEEWDKVNGGWRNNRYFPVYKTPLGISHDDSQRTHLVFPDGVTQCSDEPAPAISFPYTPSFPPMVRVDVTGKPVQ